MTNGLKIDECDCGTILGVLEEAAEEDARRGRFRNNPFLSMERKTAHAAPIVSPVLNAIPDQLGICAIHGALALVLSVSNPSEAGSDRI